MIGNFEDKKETTTKSSSRADDYYTMRLKALEPERWWHKYLFIKRKFVDFGVNFGISNSISPIHIVTDKNKDTAISDIKITELDESCNLIENGDFVNDDRWNVMR